MNPTDVAVPASGRGIIVGSSGSEQYTTLNLDNESVPVRCGGTTVSTGINSISALTESNNNSYSYIVTGDSASELKIIKGGPGGGNGQGQGYPPSGDFTSSVFDSQSSMSKYFLMSWQGTQPINTTLKFQLRYGNSSDLSSAIWIGPDGTSSSYFSGSKTYTLPSAISNNRYIQYKAYYLSDTISTSVMEKIVISYQK
jgi:hypothetical protein